RSGLFRVDRLTGETVWGNGSADRFLAANPKFTYAMDRSNMLMVLDRKRGTELSQYCFRDFVFPVSNELTDRIYLAANDGLFVSLHDRDYPTPVEMKKVPEPRSVLPPGKGEPKEPGGRPAPKQDEMPRNGGKDKEMNK